MDNPQTLEQMLEQIDELVKKMESGKLPLSEHLSLFEQGVGLSKDCEKALKDAEGKVKILTDSQSLANGTKTGDDVVSDFNAGI